jgi:hypothetical protein
MAMNDAEAKRDKRIARMTDHDLLNLLLADATGGVRPDEHKAFGEMRRWVADDLGAPIVGRVLSTKQRTWVEEAARRIVPVDSRDVPKGKPVEKPEVLKNLPLAPPGRKPR